MQDGKQLIKRKDDLRQERSSLESHWRRVARYVWPAAEKFQGETVTEGEYRHNQVYDSTASLANGQFASILESLTIPRHQRWHTLEGPLPVEDEDTETAKQIEQMVKIMFHARYRAAANFQPQANICYQSVGAFGNCALFIDWKDGVGLRYKQVHIGDLYIDTDHTGRIDSVYHCLDLTARQLEQRLAESGTAAPDDITRLAKDKPSEKVKVTFCVTPNDKYNPDSPAVDTGRYQHSLVWDEKHTVLETGYSDTMPYAIGRYQVAPGEKYGRGPGMNVLPHILQAQEQKRTLNRAGQLAVEPPVLLHDDGLYGAPFNLRPGAANHGFVNEAGQQLAVPFQSGANPMLGAELLELEHRPIADAFLLNLFQILVQSHTMSATEAAIRNQEKGALLAPVAAFAQSDFIPAIIERELELLIKNGVITDIPTALGDDPDIVYQSPISRLQRSEELVGIQTLLSMAKEIAQYAPEELRNLNANDIFHTTRVISGAPATSVHSADEVARMDAAQSQQQVASQLVEAAPKLAKAEKDMAQAAQLRAGV